MADFTIKSWNIVLVNNPASLSFSVFRKRMTGKWKIERLYWVPPNSSD